MRIRACPVCSKPYLPGQVIYGWRNCDCPAAAGGGHTTGYCRPDTGGCGHTAVEDHVGPEPEPEPEPERLPDFGQGRRSAPA